MTRVSCEMDDCDYNANGHCFKSEISIVDGHKGQLCVDWKEEPE